MRPITVICSILMIFCLSAAAGFGQSPLAEQFESKIRPILISRCAQCHGSEQQKGGLRLDVRHSALKGGSSGPVIVAGDSAASEMIRRVVSTDPELRMPQSSDPLPLAEIELLQQWIEDGANWPESDYDRAALHDPRMDHWAWQPVQTPAIPVSSFQHPIDAFLEGRLHEAGLQFAEVADRRTLIRRANLMLTGLLPTPEEVNLYVASDSETAFEDLVNRLLESSAYGEKQAIHWLDVVRFSESDGFEEDSARPEAWTYRDYVIEAFNRDLPYDQFVREQIAGDVMEPVTGSSIAATGMLVSGPWDSVQRITPSRLGRLQSREEQLEEIVGAVAQTFMGVTANCARCHDHKFDPVPQSDYYRLKSVFEGVDHGLSPKVHGLRRRMGPVEEVAWNEATAELRKSIAELEQTVQKLEQQPVRDEKQQHEAKQQLNALRDELKTRFPVVMAFTGDREQPQPTVIFERGDVRKPGNVVEPAGLSLFSSISGDLQLAPDAPEGERRIRFARWLTDPKHPLTARVMVNRIWQQHFGTGLIETPSDFGINGDPPSHPELLDWLATEFVRSGWSVKSLHRLIMTSHAWRQKSMIASELAIAASEKDAANRLLWRFPLRPLEGEVTRDVLLQLSGALNREMGGPSFKQYTTSRLNTYFYHLFDSDEPQFNRRTVYRMHIITGRSPFLDALDCPSPSIAVPRRRPTVTPLQALALMNDPFVVRQAERMSQHLAEQSQDRAEQIRRAFELSLCRPPDDSELQSALSVAQEHGLRTVCWGLFNSSEFLNLH